MMGRFVLCSAGHSEVVNWVDSFITVGTASGTCREGVAEHG
jgi:hypothetical protein